MEAEMRDKLKQQQEEQERLARQLEEAEAVAQSARADAAKAQATADYANNRINGLDEFEPIKTVTIYFTTGSSVLGPKAKSVIDNAAAWVKTQNPNGWVMAVIGYADSTGNTARNRTLSEQRAGSVIYSQVTKYGLPTQRLVQPFGYGQLKPVAENKTASGCAKNRRAETRLMVNRGIASKVSQGK